MKSPEEIDRILQRYLNDECTASEKSEVEQWFQGLAPSDLNDSDRDAIIMRRLKDNIDRKTVTSLTFPWYRIAAAFVVLIVAGGLWLTLTKDDVQNHLTQVAAEGALTIVRATELKTLHLEDGSMITLSAGSELRYPSTFGPVREVYLKGEGAFDIARDVNRPFLVYANEVTTRVLGTSFVIRAFEEDKDITVQVKTGKVSVAARSRHNSSKPPAEYILTPNQQVVYNRSDDQVVRTLVEQPQAISKQPVLQNTFTTVPVSDVLDGLARKFGIHIQYDSTKLSACTLSYSTIMQEDLYDQIEIICNALGARFEKTETSIVIDAEGCNTNPQNDAPMR